MYPRIASIVVDDEILARSFDAERANQIVNDPSVRPSVGGDPEQELDMSRAIADLKNIFLDGDHGGFLLIWTAPKAWEIHTFILPSGRGKWAFDAARFMMDVMREDYGAQHLWTRILPEHRHTQIFARRGGLSPAGWEIFDLGNGPEKFDLFDWRQGCPQQQ